MNAYEQCRNDKDTVESLALEIEELKGELSRVRKFLNQQFDAGSCEHCGQILVRKHMLAPYGLGEDAVAQRRTGVLAIAGAGVY